MGRYYHLSKQLDDEKEKRISAELQEMPDVKIIKFTSDHQFVEIETEDNEFTEVMGKAINIFSREANGTELSFERFAV